MLGGLRLLLSVNGGDVGDMDVHEVPGSGFVAKLSQCLNKGHALDVADSASQLDDTHVRFLARPIHGDLGNALDPVFDGVCDVRYAAKVSKTATRDSARARHGWIENIRPTSVGGKQRGYRKASMMVGTYIWTVFPR